MTTEAAARSPIVAAVLAGALLLLVACEPAPNAPNDSKAATASSPVAAKPLQATSWVLPSPNGASLPDLAVTPSGEILLSWVEKNGQSSALRFSRFSDGKWAEPMAIATGDWFGSSVDTPHLRMTEDGALWAQWLRKTKTEGHARDVVLSRSPDGGIHWAKPVPVNTDGTPTEHGFVAMWPMARDRVGIAWLDGRATAERHGAAHAHGTSMQNEAGADMTMLRAAEFDADLQRTTETAVDTSSCDCCQTDVALTAHGPLLAYRDRMPGEVRDIAVRRLASGNWSSPTLVHADNWVMAGCPINGPAVAADGALVAVAWYTGAGEAPSVRLAFSADAGKSFEAPIDLGRGPAMLGRTDVALTARTAWVTWLTEDQTGQSLWLARVERASRQAVTQRLVTLQGSGRATGFPKTVASAGEVHVVWTDVADGTSRLMGVTIAE